jgi:RNA polymerase sigma-70 factor (ECF subfamily)
MPLDAETKKLLRQAQEGDMEAFATVFEQFRPLMSTVAYRLVGSNDSDDVVMDSFLKAWRALPTVRNLNAVRSWLCQTVRNTALDLLRKQNRISARVLENTPDEDGHELLDQVADQAAPVADRQNELSELTDILQDVLGELGEDHKTVILLREADGLSYQEIASATGVGIGTVMSRLFYAKRKLRKLLTERGVTL